MRGFSGSSIGLLQAIYGFPNIVIALIWGLIVDRIGAGASNSDGYHAGMVWAFSGLGFAAPAFAFLLRRSERGPDGHGLETIAARG